jgi:hypothetical protein
MNFVNDEIKYSQRSRWKNKLIPRGRLLIIKLKWEVLSGIGCSEFLMIADVSNLSRAQYWDCYV